MGAKIKREGETLEIDPRGVKNQPMPYGKSIACVLLTTSMVVFLAVLVKQL